MNLYKILLFDREVSCANKSKNTLLKLGYEDVNIVNDFEIIMETLKNEVYNLIVFDVSKEVNKVLEFTRKINASYNIPIIYTSDKNNLAIFELVKKENPIYYLFKPLQKKRLFVGIEMAILNFKSRNTENVNTSSLIHIKQKNANPQIHFIKSKLQYKRIIIDEILWLKSDGNYLEIYFEGKKEVIRSTLTSFLVMINDSYFYQTHKSFAVNIRHLSIIENSTVRILTNNVPITKVKREELLNRMNIV